jgi:hypothetical protein
VDASVQRVQPEPVVTGPRGSARPRERQKREGQQHGDEPAPSPHTEPHSPKGDGLGEKLDVIA